MTIDYLSPVDLVVALRFSGSIEQWLGHSTADNYRALAWLRIEQNRDGGIEVTKFDVFDDGTDTFVDIYEFEAIDPDNAFGVTREFSVAEDALSFCASHWGADNAKYVRGGDIQLIYEEFLKTHGPPPSPDASSNSLDG